LTFDCGAFADSSLNLCETAELMLEDVRVIDLDADIALGGKRSAGVLQK
jgi:hypothetical protein